MEQSLLQEQRTPRFAQKTFFPNFETLRSRYRSCQTSRNVIHLMFDLSAGSLPFSTLSRSMTYYCVISKCRKLQDRRVFSRAGTRLHRTAITNRLNPIYFNEYKFQFRVIVRLSRRRRSIRPPKCFFPSDSFLSLLSGLIFLSTSFFLLLFSIS